MLSHIVASLLVCSQAIGQLPPKIADIEGKVLASRRAIKSGHLIFDGKLRSFERSQEYHLTVFFSGKKIRQDKTIRNMPFGVAPPGAVGRDGTETRDYTEISCFGDEEHIFWSPNIMPDGGTMVLQIRDLRKMSTGFEVVEPRILGLAPLSFQMSSRMFRLDSFIGAADRENLTVVPDTRGGIECVKIEFKPPGFHAVRAWIAPALGYNVIRMEEEYRGEGGDYIDSVDLEIKKHEKSGLWFPSSQHYQRVETGNRVTREEHLKITVVSLNEPVDPVVFTPAGMNVRPGTSVEYLPEGRTAIWDGSKIVESRPATYPPASQGADRRWMLFASLSALFILFAVFFGRQYYNYRRRRVS